MHRALKLALYCVCLTLAASLWASPPPAQPEPENPILVIFRCDDYRAVAADEQADVEWPAMKQLIELFRGHGMPLDVAITPFRPPVHPGGGPDVALSASPEQVAYLREVVADGSIEPCLHGYEHRDHGLWTDASEFAGTPAEEQAEMIRKGRAELEQVIGRRISIFVPPFNRYDPATEQALVDAGIPTLSAVMTMVPTNPLLAHIPVTTRFVNLPEALKAAEAHDETSLVICGIHPFEVKGVYPELLQSRGSELIGLDELDAVLNRLAANPRVRVVRLSDIAFRHPEFATVGYQRLQRSVYAVWPTPYLNRLAALVSGERSGHTLWNATVYYRLFPVLLLPAAAGLILGLLLSLALVRPSQRRVSRVIGRAVCLVGLVAAGMWVHAGMLCAWSTSPFRPKSQVIIWLVLGLMLGAGRLARRRRPAS
jgi:peptidoglycan/xylan/chitin deacetylase (PgdA/CDA1 family)